MSDHLKYCNISDSSVEINTEDYTDINIEEKKGDELLIELYRERTFLYDKSNINFKDCLMKQNAWLEISKIMTQICDMYNPSYCQKRCTTLRDQYNRGKRKIEIESKSGSGATKAIRFPFFAQLAFLDRVIQRRRSYTNYAKSQPFIVDEGSNESQSAANALSSEENENVNGQLFDKFKRFNKENIAPKMKKWKVDETKELEQS
ncbi:hypothetical protein ALC57_12728 [Trachymyrmex cornetzi]|uniref:MADF domain-containing protein n=1 Tax=Trachymyrmex cornetzi TaxID=471704 RepID=A0A151J0N9_9HYME|nr:hypothetical protein ALC57_12728 [Trachymyrmex cornetzi]